MAIKYHVVERKVPAGADKGKILYYAQVRSNQTVSFDKICEEIESRSTATAGDVAAVLRGLLQIVKESLEAGHIVHLGKLGRLRVSAGSSGTEKEEELTAHKIKNTRIVFTPGPMLRQMLTDIEYLRRDPLVKYVSEDEPCPFPH